MTVLVQLLVLAAALASVVLPFAVPIRPGTPYEPFVTVPTDGPPRKRQRVAAAILLAIVPFGLYLVWRKSPSLWPVIVGPAIVFVLLIELLSDRLIKKYLIPVGRWYLVAAGIAAVIIFTLVLFATAFTLELRVDRYGDLFIWSFDKSPAMFCINVATTALVNGAFLRILREWLVRRRRRRIGA